MMIFYQNKLFLKIISGIPSECLKDLIKIQHNILLSLIWVQTVCNGYEQMTKLACRIYSKEISMFNFSLEIVFTVTLPVRTNAWLKLLTEPVRFPNKKMYAYPT